MKVLKRNRKPKEILETRGSVTTFCPGESKTIEIDGTKHTLPREFFEGFNGWRRVFCLNYPILAGAILGVFWAIAICSIVGVFLIFAFMSFGSKSAGVFGLGGGQRARYQGDGRDNK